MNTASKANNTMRANIILGIVLFSFFVSLTFFVGSGLKKGELQTKVINPIKSALVSLGKKIETAVKEDSAPRVRSTSTVIINNQTSVNESAKGSVRIIQNGKTIQSIDYSSTQPTTPNPTILKFQQDFETTSNQIKTQNAESLKNFCAKMPSASVCKQ